MQIPPYCAVCILSPLRTGTLCRHLLQQVVNIAIHRIGRADVPVLRGFNLVIPPNKHTALVGGSGSGKSTVVGLILR